MKTLKKWLGGLLALAALASIVSASALAEGTPEQKSDQAALTLPAVADKTYGNADFTVTVGGGSGTGAYSLTADPAECVSITGPTGSGKNVFTLKPAKASGANSITLRLSKAADDDYNVAADVTTTFKIAKADPVIEDFNVIFPTGDALKYSGTAKEATVTPRDGVTGMGDITVQYKKGEDAPANEAIGVGSYTVLISTASGGNFNATSAPLAYSRTLDIAKATPTADDFTVTLPDSLTYDGSAKAATVEAKGGVSGMGSITRVRYKRTDTGEVYSTAVGAGTYKVLITTETGTNYTSTDDLDSGVSFTIAKADPVIGDFTVTLPTGEDLRYTGTDKTVIVTGKGGMGDISVQFKKDGGEASSDPPRAVGTYQVLISTTEGTNYKATTSALTYAATFTITPTTPTIGNFAVTLPTGDALKYDGTAKTVTVEPKNGLGIGASDITVKYKKGDAAATTAAPTAVGTYKVLISTAAGGNYDAVTDADYGFAFTVEPAPLTVTAKPKTITYGDAPANDGVTYSGFVNNETESALDVSGLSFAYDYAKYDDAGDSYKITPAGVTAENYDVTFRPGTLTVEPKEIGLSWSHYDDLIYNGAEQKPTAEATGLFTAAQTGRSADDACTVTVTGGQTNAREDYSYAATASSLSNRNYKLPAENEKLFIIARKPATVTAKDQTINLDAAISSAANKATLTDALSGHTLSSVTLRLRDGVSTASAGTTENAILASNAVIQNARGTDVTANYTITYHNGDLTVKHGGQAVVTTAPKAKQGLVYDATGQELLDVEKAGANTSLEYKLDGEADYSSDVPTGIDAGDYKVWYRAKADASHDVGAEKSLTVTIAQRPVTVTVTATDRDYRAGDRSVALVEGEVVDRIGSEPVSVDVSEATGVMANDGAGEDKPVTVTGVKLGGLTKNYKLTAQPTGVTVTIRQIDYTGEKTAAASVLPGKTETVSISGLIAAGGTAGTPAVSAAAYSIDPDTVALTGTTLSFTAESDAEKGKTATITVPVTGMANHKPYDITVTVTVADKKTVTLSASDITKTYDGSPAANGDIRGTAQADGKNVPGTWSFKSGQGLTNVADTGTKVVVFTPDDPTSYKGGTTTLTLTVSKAAVTVTALDRRVTLGGTVPSLASPARDTDYTVSADVVSGAVTLKYQKDGADVTPSAAEAGTYDIVIGGVTPADPDNYTLKCVNGKLTVAAATLYQVKVADGIRHGTLAVSTASAAEGTTVTVTATPDSGYALDAITTTPTLTVSKNSFVMPAENVTVSATFKVAPLSGTVRISGSAYVGETLTATLINSNNTGTLTYQWKANGTNISGATSDTFRLTTSVVGKSVTCTVTSTAPAGSVTSSALTVYSDSSRTDEFWLDETQLYLAVGESGYLTARTWTGRLYDDEVRWRSSNSKVVSVDSYGNYYAEGTGSAVIYATLVGYSGYSAYCNVTVSRYYNSNNNNRTSVTIEQPTIPSGTSTQSTTTQTPTLQEIKQTTTTNRDGSKQTVIAKADGSSSIVQTDGVGRVISAAVTYSQSAVDGASWSNSALVLPATVRASYGTSGAPELRIVMPQTTQGAYVKIPVENMTAGTVAIIENAFGPDEIVRNSTSLSDGLMIKLKGSAVVKIVDNSRQFYDVNSTDWYASAVAWVTSHGVMNGVSEHMFDPDGQMNRAMMTQILYNFAGASSTNVTSAFSDVSAKDWYGKSVTWASDNGIAHIFDDSFGATDPLTREDMASMLYNYAKKMGYNTSAAGNLLNFSDSGSISPWARSAVEWAVGAGLLGGVGSDRLAPQGVATRGQLATIMQRFCENVVK